MSLGPLMIDIAGTSLTAEERRRLTSPLVGGVILFARNFADRLQLESLVAEIHAVRDPPLLVAVDQEGGRVQRFREPFFRLPPPRLLGRLYREDKDEGLAAARAFGWLMAAELRAVGVDLSFAPVVDLDLGLADVIGDRALDRDPKVVVRLARAFLSGAAGAGMIGTAKHFPTHAGVASDSHTEIAEDRRDYEDLLDDIAPYRELIACGLHSIMVAHVIFPKLDASPASLSAWWIKNQLRAELGFHGAVISDDLSMAGAKVAGGPAARVRRALDAGCDLVLLCNAPDDVPEVLDSLEGFVDPVAQLRLMRLRGGRRRDWAALTASAEWRAARERLERLVSKPALELEG
ncbi:MAG TPA: beta-N-acetylhexosaminidase [Gammaproteobacteria bacterium]|nr:beta-N-acetylhexosaminidase [Gammaproteobacteria bacterium]